MTGLFPTWDEAFFIMRYLRLLRVAMILLAVVLVVFLARQRQLILNEAQRTLTLQLSSLLGEQLSIERIEINWLDMSVEAQGIQVAGYDPSETPPILWLPSLTAQFASLPARDHIHFRTIRLLGPTLTIPFHDGKPLPFSDLLDALAASDTSSEAAPPEGADVRFDIDRIELLDGRVTLRDSSQDWEISLEDVGAALSLVDGAPCRVELSVGGGDVSMGTRSVTLEGAQVQAKLDSDPIRFRSLKLRGGGLSLEAEGSIGLPKAPDAPPSVAAMRNDSLQR